MSALLPFFLICDWQCHALIMHTRLPKCFQWNLSYGQAGARIYCTIVQKQTNSSSVQKNNLAKHSACATNHGRNVMNRYICLGSNNIRKGGAFFLNCLSICFGIFFDTELILANADLALKAGPCGPNHWKLQEGPGLLPLV